MLNNKFSIILIEIEFVINKMKGTYSLDTLNVSDNNCNSNYKSYKKGNTYGKAYNKYNNNNSNNTNNNHTKNNQSITNTDQIKSIKNIKSLRNNPNKFINYNNDITSSVNTLRTSDITYNNTNNSNFNNNNYNDRNNTLSSNKKQPINHIHKSSDIFFTETSCETNTGNVLATNPTHRVQKSNVSNLYLFYKLYNFIYIDLKRLNIQSFIRK